MSSISRRKFLTQSSALGVLAGSGSLLKADSAGLAAPLSARSGAPKIIFLVSDGMSVGILPMAELMCQQLRGRGTHWNQAMQQAVGEAYTGMMDMSSATGSVTDSAAAASSWGSGVRVENGKLNVTPDGARPEPIMVTARKRGMAGGLVTTARLTHATPAGFIANVESRDHENLIAEQYLARGCEVLLGGGIEHFTSDRREDRSDLLGQFAASGYACVQTRDAMLQADRSKRLLGLFGIDHLPYSVDRDNDEALRATVPTLAEMTATALERLERAQGGFLLQVEAARVDHGAHANDTPASLFDQLAFDDAIGVAMEFRNRHPDTILIITTDHGNANPGLNGTGHFYRDANHLFAKVGGMTASYERVMKTLRAQPEPDAVIEAIRAFSRIEITPADAAVILKALSNERPHPHRAQSGAIQTFSAVMANYTAVGWTGSTHTADYCPLIIQGAPYQHLPQFIKNTELYTFLRSLIS